MTMLASGQPLNPQQMQDAQRLLQGGPASGPAGGMGGGMGMGGNMGGMGGGMGNAPPSQPQMGGIQLTNNNAPSPPKKIDDGFGDLFS